MELIMTDERSLGEAAAPSEDDTPETSLAEPVTDDITAKARAFDMSDWLEGIRPVRGAVRVFLAAGDEADAALVELEKLADEIDRAPDGPELDAMIDRAVELQELLRGQWVIMEAHSQERRTADADKWVAELDLDVESAETRVRDGSILTACLAAEQIVEPAITAADLLELARVRWPEAHKLITLAGELNARSVSENPSVQRDFTRRRSGRR